jgi:hypothetical protein
LPLRVHLIPVPEKRLPEADRTALAMSALDSTEGGRGQVMMKELCLSLALGACTGFRRIGAPAREEVI